MYDAMDRLALECEISYSCLGRGGEFVLIDHTAPDESTYLVSRALENGWHHIGVFGLKDGVPRVECYPGYDNIYTMMLAGLAFCRVVADRLRHPLKGDSVEWLQSLYALPDVRP